MTPIDLRSDTVTTPTPKMRRAMADAPVGDDVYGEDPTVNELQRRAAALVGHEAALFVPSGTMGNLAALLALCGRGQEVLLGDESHIFHYEAGGASALGGLIYHPVATAADGTLDLIQLEGAVRPHGKNAHFAMAGVICLENTHNRMGGVVVAVDHARQVAEIATRHNIAVHLDGARIFNAAAATGRPVTDWTRHATTVQFCLSKGLGAPVGSLLAGPSDVVERAWRYRKMLGGGMRQAGVLAAAGLVALETITERLKVDHANARDFSNLLRQVPDIHMLTERVETNIVIFEPPASWLVQDFVSAASRSGVLLTAFGGRRIRAMTHADVDLESCRRAAAIIAELTQARPQSEKQ